MGRQERRGKALPEVREGCVRGKCQEEGMFVDVLNIRHKREKGLNAGFSRKRKSSGADPSEVTKKGMGDVLRDFGAGAGLY